MSTLCLGQCARIVWQQTTPSRFCRGLSICGSVSGGRGLSALAHSSHSRLASTLRQPQSSSDKGLLLTSFARTKLTKSDTTPTLFSHFTPKPTFTLQPPTQYNIHPQYRHSMSSTSSFTLLTSALLLVSRPVLAHIVSLLRLCGHQRIQGDVARAHRPPVRRGQGGLRRLAQVKLTGLTLPLSQGIFHPSGSSNAGYKAESPESADATDRH